MTPPATHGRVGTGVRRRCSHGPAARQVEPLSTGCLPCRQQGEGWVELWLCLSCGWVACCDNSPNQHAKAHYQETDHPVAARSPDGAHRRWCYVHDHAI